MNEIYIFILLVSSFVSLFLALAVLFMKSGRGRISFFFLMVSSFIWSFGYSLEIFSQKDFIKLFWLNFQQIGIYYSTVLWFILAVEMSKFRRYFKGLYIFLLLVIPAVHIVLNFTNDFHHLLRKNISFIDINNFIFIKTETTLFFGIFIVFYYALLLFSLLIMIYSMFSEKGVYRKQIILLIFSFLLPLISSVAVLFNVNPFYPISPTSIVFILSGILMIYAFYRYRIFALYPAAKDAVFENIQVGLIVTDINRRICDINKYAFNILNADSSVIGKEIGSVNEVLRNYLVNVSNITIIKISGKLYEVKRTRIFDNKNVTAGEVIELYDVTLREKTVEKLKEANNAKSMFLSNISHELKTPLNSIIGYNYLMQKTQLNDIQKKYSEIINISSSTLLEMIGDILDFSRLDKDRVELKIVKTGIVKLLEDVFSIIREQGVSKGLDMSLNICSPFPEYAYIDPVRLRQIILKILDNAVKFTNEGFVVLTAYFVPAGSYDGIFSFEVKDSGIGIASDQQVKLFTAFAQADFSSTRKVGGFGIGLSIANELVKKMGGYIEIDSRVGQGSVFSFSIKAAYESGRSE